MKKTVFMLIALLAAVVGHCQADSTWRPDVKTAILSMSGDVLAAPVLPLEGDGRLTLQFDLLADQPLDLQYSISHCDADWHPDDLQPSEFLMGFATAPVENYGFSFTTTVPYIHYHQTFPDDFTRFSHSGNYLLTVHLAGEPDSVLLTRRFCVTEEAVKVEAQVVRPHDGFKISERQQVDVLVSSRDLRLDRSYLKVRVEQNRRLDNRRALQFSGFDRDRLCFRDRPCNIFPGGNNFRFFDMSNLRATIYNVLRVERYGGETFVALKPEALRGGKPYVAETTLPGGMKVHIWDRDDPDHEADYAWVNFSLPMKTPILDGTLHVVGQLTDWRLDERSQMTYNPQFKAYTLRLLLKQGYYSYQILLRPLARGSEGETWLVEGDHSEAPNRYTVYVYQRSPSDRADRLLSVRTVVR